MSLLTSPAPRGFRAIAVLVAAILAVFPAAALAQEAPPPLDVGAEVVLRGPDLTLRADRRDVPTGGDCQVYRVQRVQGPWLWVVSDARRGWILRDQVIPAERAVETFTEILEHDPSAPWAHLWRAQARLARKELDLARADLDEALRRNPRDTAALVLRGIVLTRLGETKLALDDLDAAARITPGDPGVYAGRALAWQAANQPEKAELDLTEALRLDPNNAATHAVRGRIRRGAGDTDAALADLNEAVRLDPRNADAFLQRGITRAERNELDWARADLDEALDLDPAQVEAYARRGNVRFLLGDFAGALEDYQEAVRIAPEDPATLNTLAWFLATCPDARHRDARRAVEAATHACERTGWTDPDLLDTLAAAHAEAADFTAAVDWETKALDLAPPGLPARVDYEKRLQLYRSRTAYRVDP